MSSAMIDTTKYLIEQTQANIGYTQSDEITIAFRNDDVNVPFMYSGRVQKCVRYLQQWLRSNLIN